MRPCCAASGFVIAALALLVLSAPGPARAASPLAAGAPVEQGEVTVNVWTYVAPGLPEKRGCRIRVVVENHTPVAVSFAGKFNGFLREKLLDAWFVSTDSIPPKGSIDRLYSCVMLPDRLELLGDSPYGYPRVCDVAGERTAPCPFKARLVSNVKTIVQP